MPDEWPPEILADALPLFLEWIEAAPDRVGWYVWYATMRASHEAQDMLAGDGRPTAFYLGKLQDGLALEPLTGYARTMVPFFARHRHARMVVLTNNADVDDLVDLDHASHTILSWTVNAPEVVRDFETHTPAVSDRIDAMRRPFRGRVHSAAHVRHSLQARCAKSS